MASPRRRINDCQAIIGPCSHLCSCHNVTLALHACAWRPRVDRLPLSCRISIPRLAACSSGEGQHRVFSLPLLVGVWRVFTPALHAFSSSEGVESDGVFFLPKSATSTATSSFSALRVTQVAWVAWIAWVASVAYVAYVAYVATSPLSALRRGDAPHVSWAPGHHAHVRAVGELLR